MKWKANICIRACFHVVYCFKPVLDVQPVCRILKCVYIYLHIVYLREMTFFSLYAQNSRIFASTRYILLRGIFEIMHFTENKNINNVLLHFNTKKFYK